MTTADRSNTLIERNGLRIFGSLRLVFLSTVLIASATCAQAAANPTLQGVLDNTTKAVYTFWKQFSSVTCTESVMQEKIGKQGKVEYAQKSSFDYLILLNMQADDLTVEESRLLQKGEGKSKNLPLLTTSGFPTLLLVFHPYYQGNYRYRLDGEDLIDGNKVVRVSFEHIGGTRSTSALELRGRTYPLDLRGTAWIDPETGSIRRMNAELETPLDDLNLKAMRVEVAYQPQRLSSDSDVGWLPSTATIDVETSRQRWHNLHRFTDYKLFSVKSESTVAK